MAEGKVLAFAAVIDDGYTLVGRMPADDDGKVALPDFEFTYRPALPERTIAYQQSLAGKTATDQGKASAALVCEHVLSWKGVKQFAGGAWVDVPKPSEDMFRKLSRPVQVAMIDAVCGYGVGEWVEEAKK